jgi:hypothetical protein
VTTFLDIIRSVWTRILLVAIVLLLVVLKLGALWQGAERGKAAADQLAAAKAKDHLIAEHFLTDEQLRAADLEARLEAAVGGKAAAEGRNADLAAEIARLRKAAPGSTTVAVLDLHTGPVVAGGRPSPPAAPAGQGGAAGGSGERHGQPPTTAAPSCSVLEGEPLDLHAIGPVMRSPEGVGVYVLKLEVTNLASGGLVAAGLVKPDLSHVLTLAPSPTWRPGWIYGAGPGKTLTSRNVDFAALVVSPPAMLPLVHWRVRWWAFTYGGPGRDAGKLDLGVFTGPAIELGVTR